MKKFLFVLVGFMSAILGLFAFSKTDKGEKTISKAKESLSCDRPDGVLDYEYECNCKWYQWFFCRCKK